MAGSRRAPEFTNGYDIYRPSVSERLGALSRLLSAHPGFAIRQAIRFPTLAIADPKLFLGCLTLAAVCWETARRERLGLISAYHLFSAGLSGAWAAELLGIPLVTTVFGEIYARPGWHRRRLREVRYICGQSQALLSCSYHCARSLELLGITRPVQAVHYGVDTNAFSPEVDGAAVRQRHRIEPGDCVVLFVGRMVREMGLHVLLDALPRLLSGNARIKVIIAGGSGELRPDAERQAEQNPGRVVVMADVAQDQLPQYYAAAAVAVSPSVNQRACLGLAVAEAMATGRAVVVTNVGGGPELVTHEGNGVLIQPESPQALADAVLSLVNDPVRRRTMADRGFAVARRDFDRQTTNQRMERVFEEALG
jgi:glycosyltransferase involved in cell wall biosynthesis